MRLDGRLITHNVGQGLFYSGTIRVNDETNPFNFIYDCGSENHKHLSKVVNYYKRNVLYKYNLDLLMISHLHNDHTIGLEYLLKDININTVILPYMSPMERLVIALKKIKLPSWYFRFLEEPIQYLINKGVKQIILMGGSGSKRGPGFDEVKPELSEKRINISHLHEDKELKERVLKCEPEIENFIHKRKLLIKNHDGYIFIFGIWGFRFFNCEVDQKKLTEFKNCVNRVIGKEDTKDIIRSKSKLRLLKPCYESIFGKSKINNTSLSVFTGPLDRYNEIYGYSTSPDQIFYELLALERDLLEGILSKYSFSTKYMGNLLTGDLDLNYKWEDFRNHFWNNFSKTFIIQIPHHGSKYNWKIDLLSRINKSFCIISSGIKNRFSHPHWKVINDISSSSPRKTIFLVNEFSKFEIKFSIRYQ